MASGPTSHSYISQRLKLHYVDWGNADAPPLLLVHGGRDHCRNWDWVAEKLRDRYHVIAPDLRGHGDSAWSPDGNYDMDAFVYDLAQLIHQLDLSPVTIVSHSMGGNVALRYTGLYPDTVSKLVAIEGLAPRQADRRTPRNARRRPVPQMDRRQTTGGGPFAAPLSDARRCAGADDGRKCLSDPEQARHLTIHGVSRNEDGTWSWKFDNYLNIWSVFDLSHDEIASLWAEITCPTLLLYGANSWASNPAKDGRIAHFKSAQVIEFENAGHWLHHDQFDRFMSTLDDFL